MFLKDPPFQELTQPQTNVEDGVSIKTVLLTVSNIKTADPFYIDDDEIPKPVKEMPQFSNLYSKNSAYRYSSFIPGEHVNYLFYEMFLSKPEMLDQLNITTKYEPPPMLGKLTRNPSLKGWRVSAIHRIVDKFWMRTQRTPTPLHSIEDIKTALNPTATKKSKHLRLTNSLVISSIRRLLTFTKKHRTKLYSKHLAVKIYENHLGYAPPSGRLYIYNVLLTRGLKIFPFNKPTVKF